MLAISDGIITLKFHNIYHAREFRKPKSPLTITGFTCVALRTSPLDFSENINLISQKICDRISLPVWVALLRNGARCFLPPSHRSTGIKELELENPSMNDQYQYVGKPLTPSIAQELIKELYTGETAERQEIILTVDDIHHERGGEPNRAKFPPVGRALVVCHI